MTYTITENIKFNSLEITFNEKPSEAIREILKSLKFRWNPTRSLWYGFTEREKVEKALQEKTAAKKQTKEKEFDFNVKAGDLFYCSWGYEQTNVNFFQVVELVGKKSVRVREVHPERLTDEATCAMAADRSYKVPDHILSPASSSIFIKDQEKGDLKKLNSFHQDKKNNPIFHVGQGGYTCYKYDGKQLYESWYY